jgi:hypothetical protein
MKLPSLENAVVPAAKVTDYLLSGTHPDGRSKAEFFMALGFTLDDWPALEKSLRQHARDHDIAKVESSPFGTRYAIEGTMKTPDGRSPLIRTVWFTTNQEETPQFVTAYPLRRRDDD